MSPTDALPEVAFRKSGEVPCWTGLAGKAGRAARPGRAADAGL